MFFYSVRGHMQREGSPAVGHSCMCLGRTPLVEELVGGSH